MDHNVITVFGGSGFIGRHLVQRLAAGGWTVRVAARDPEAAQFLKTMGAVGQVVPVAADIGDRESVAGAIAGAGAVVNLVGLLSEWGRQTFQRIHVEGAANVAACAAEAGVERLVQVSALGADPDSPSVYARTKAAGEAAVKEAFPGAQIIRPSVVFGPEDQFFNKFAGLARLSPVLPVFGCPLFPTVKLFPEGGLIAVDIYGNGGTRFQPVYVGDVADAIMAVLGGAGSGDVAYELGGPTIYSSKEIMDLLLATIGRRRFLVSLPFWYLKFYAWFLEKLPLPLLTRDQVTLLRFDNVTAPGAPGLKELGIEATAAEVVLPTYLQRFRRPRRPSLRAA